jgi:hypothetical protein
LRGLVASGARNVPRRTLYKELNAVAGELARRIVQDLAEYEKAPWGD